MRFLRRRTFDENHPEISRISHPHGDSRCCTLHADHNRCSRCPSRTGNQGNCRHRRCKVRRLHHKFRYHLRRKEIGTYWSNPYRPVVENPEAEAGSMVVRAERGATGGCRGRMSHILLRRRHASIFFDHQLYTIRRRESNYRSCNQMAAYYSELLYNSMSWGLRRCIDQPYSL